MNVKLGLSYQGRTQTGGILIRVPRRIFEPKRDGIV
jgi:hypothetical protein